MFDNRYDAGQQRAEKLIKYKDQSNELILSIPSGGKVCVHFISSMLGLPFEIEYINIIALVRMTVFNTDKNHVMVCI